MMSEEDEESLDAKLFKEPEGYYKPETPETYAEHTLLSGEALKLRLVGHNPLWVMFTPQRGGTCKLNSRRDICCGTLDE